MNRFQTILFWSLLLPVTAFAAHSLVDAETRLAVLDLTAGKGVDADEAKALSGFVRAAIVQSGQMEVMDRDQMVSIFAEQSFSQAFCDNEKCLVKAGKILDVNRVLGGSVGKFAERWTITLCVVDVSSSRLINSAATSYEGAMSDLLSVAPAVAFAVLGLKGAPSLPSVLAAGAASRSAEGKPWINSLGMKFVPVVGTNVLFSIWETRVQDYQVFVSATRRSWKKPSFVQAGTHPVVKVSWEDAKVFCQWLTEKELQEGRLNTGQSYRLPTDAEWSTAVGLTGEMGRTPEERSKKIADIYPWGVQWPPPRDAGNYDASLKLDRFEETAPVGSFAANHFGIYDLGGNVWEWCEDWYDNDDKYRVLRGGSYASTRREDLLSSKRNYDWPDSHRDKFGFRVVLAAGSAR